MIMLGNLSVKEIEDRLGIEFPEEIREFMQANKQEEATKIKAGKWHCYDIPFTIVCGDLETAKKIYYSVAGKSALCKEPLQFSVQG